VLLSDEVPSCVDIGAVHLLEDAFSASDADVKEALAEPVELIKAMFFGKVGESSLSDICQQAAESGLKGWYQIYCHLQWPEIWSCLGAWVEESKPEFGPATRRNFELVKSIDREMIVKAARQREIYFSLLKEFLGPNDLLCIPTAPILAPIKGTLGFDRTAEDYYPRTLSMTAIAGIGRLPQVSLPMANVAGVPVGLSLLAGQGRDAFLLAAAGLLRSASDDAQKR
jgi:amidase